MKTMSLREHLPRLRLRRPRLQYGLRSLMAATVALCLALGWHVERVHRQRRAVAALKEAGATVEFSIASLNHYDMGRPRPHGTEATEIDDPGTVAEWIEWLTPRRLRKSLGTDFFRHVEYVNFNSYANNNFNGVKDLPSVVQHLRDLPGVRILDLGPGPALDDDLPAVGQLRDLTHLDARLSSISDAGLVYLAPLRKLEHLHLSYNAITGTGLAHIARFQRLEYLDLSSNPINDAGLVHLGELRRVKHLDLSRSKVTGAGLGHLAEMSDLESLDLEFTKLTDEHTVHLANFRRLKNLSLAFTAVGDAGLRNLRDLRSVESLKLGWTMVTDHGLESIRSFRSLKTLDLTGTEITDQGLRALGKLTLLKSLFIDQTAASPEGVAWLKRRLPKTDIQFHEQFSSRYHALVLMRAGLWQQALKALPDERELEELGELDPEAPGELEAFDLTDFLCDLGQCHAGLAQWDDAERVYCKALEQVPHEPSTHRCGEDIWRELDAWPQLFERVAAARPDDAWRWVTPARWAVIDGRWPDAVAGYARAAACPSMLAAPVVKTPEALEDYVIFEYGISRLLAGDIVEALRVRDRLVRGDPSIQELRQASPEEYDYTDYTLFAAAHLQLLAPQGTACPPAIAAWPRDEQVWFRRLVPLVYLRTGKFAQVLSEQAGHDQDDYARFWFSQSMAHHYLEHGAEARRCFARGKQWLDRLAKEARIVRAKERPIDPWFEHSYTCELLEAEVLRREAEKLIFN